MKLARPSGTDDGDRLTPPTPTPASVPDPSVADGFTRTVHHDGNQYFATAEMAEIFRGQAERIVADGETQLVPLSHRRGVDLLLVSPRTVFAVVTIEVGRLR